MLMGKTLVKVLNDTEQFPNKLFHYFPELQGYLKSDIPVVS